MVNRITPNLSVGSYQTFAIRTPVVSQRKATCEEVECSAYLNGWKTTIDEGTPTGEGQAAYIRKNSGRSFKENKLESGLTEFIFSSGQPCFAQDSHTIVNSRAERYLVRDGDWRGNPTGRHMQHTRAEHWVEHFAEQQDKIATVLERG